MEPTSFIVEFYEHVPERDHKHWLDLLRNRGAQIEQRGERVYRIASSESSERQLRGMKTLILTRAMQTLCRITETTD